MTTKSFKTTKSSDGGRGGDDKHVVSFREDMDVLQAKVEKSQLQNGVKKQQRIAHTEINDGDVNTGKADGLQEPPATSRAPLETFRAPADVVQAPADNLNAPAVDTVRAPAVSQQQTGDMIFLTHTNSRFAVCQHEKLNFCFDNNNNEPQKRITLNLDEIQNGRRTTLKLPLQKKTSNRTSRAVRIPKQILVKREIAKGMEQQTVCELNLQHGRQFADDNTPRDQNKLPNNTNSNNTATAHALNRIRMKLIQTVDIRRVMDDVSKLCVFTFDEQHDIRHQKTPLKRAEIFLNCLTQKPLDDVKTVCTTLEETYDGIGQELRLILGI